MILMTRENYLEENNKGREHRWEMFDFFAQCSEKFERLVQSLVVQRLSFLVVYFSWLPGVKLSIINQTRATNLTGAFWA